MNRTQRREWCDALTAKLHDLWFSVDDLAINSKTHELVLPLRATSRECPIMKLVVPNASALDIKDTERIVYYDINRVEIDDDERYLLLHGNIPVCVSILVNNPYLSYTITYDKASI